MNIQSELEQLDQDLEAETEVDEVPDKVEKTVSKHFISQCGTYKLDYTTSVLTIRQRIELGRLIKEFGGEDSTQAGYELAYGLAHLKLAVKPNKQNPRGWFNKLITGDTEDVVVLTDLAAEVLKHEHNFRLSQFNSKKGGKKSK